MDDDKIVSKMHNWICEIVWSANKDHLHALSAKCNDGNVSGPFLSSMPTTLIHCRGLWESVGRPAQFRSNVSTSNQGDELMKSRAMRYDCHLTPCISDVVLDSDRVV